MPIKLKDLINHLKAAEAKAGNVEVHLFDNWGKPLHDPVLAQRDGTTHTKHLQFREKEDL